METTLGQSLSHVRVHEDHRATLMSGNMGARAFTVGNDIFFPPGQYDPRSQAGQQVLAHELAHVVQQSGKPPVDNK
jgi:hypothetical protein